MQYKQNFYISKKLVSAFEKISNQEELTTKEVKALYKELDNAYKKGYVILFEYGDNKKMFYDSETFRKGENEYTLAIPDVFLNSASSISIKSDGTYDVSVLDTIINGYDILPGVVNDRYLHTNEETGALEWSEVSGVGPTGYKHHIHFEGHGGGLSNPKRQWYGYIEIINNSSIEISGNTSVYQAIRALPNNSPIIGVINKVVTTETNVVITNCFGGITTLSNGTIFCFGIERTYSVPTGGTWPSELISSTTSSVSLTIGFESGSWTIKDSVEKL